ncbi:hypothetical protein PENTCL1PPCAC_19601, partial [Pristionchus entomophagus]
RSGFSSSPYNMISNLLLMSMCLPLAWACVPVKPGEDMPCPTVPFAAAIPGQITSPLESKVGAGGTMVYYCETGYTMYSDDGTALPAATELQCKPNSGMLTQNGAPIGSKKYACTKPADCKLCDAAFMNLYDATNTAQPSATAGIPPPDCLYECPADSAFTVNDQTHKSVICRMDTQAITLDTATGPTLAVKTSCAACTCMDSDLSSGSDLCAIRKLCTKAKFNSFCSATCPDKSVSIYKDATGTVLTSSPDISCVKGSWVKEVIPGTATVAACQYDDGAGFETEPAAPCTKLAPFACVAGCNPDNLIYVKSENGWTAMCKDGSFITPNFGIDASSASCTPPNGFMSNNQVITEANCVTDESQVADCLAELPDPSVMNNVKFDCAFGECFLTCNTAGQMFEYMDIALGQIVKNQNIKCIGPEPFSVTAGSISDVKCVV